MSTTDPPAVNAEPVRLGLKLVRCENASHLVQLVYSCEYRGRIMIRSSYWFDEREMMAVMGAMSFLSAGMMSDSKSGNEPLPMP